MASRRVIVPVVEPFDFGLSLSFLQGFAPMSGEQKVSNGTLVKSWIVGKQPITVTMTDARPGIACTLASNKRIDDDRADAIADRVSAFLSTNDDLSEFYALARRDTAFEPVARKLRGLHHPRFASPFEAACWGVINQRIPLAQAKRLKSALVGRWGDEKCDAFPEASTLARAKHGDLRKLLGGNERKAKAVWSVSQAFADVDEMWLETAPTADVETWLRNIYGVGDFTTGFVLYRGLGRGFAGQGAFTLRQGKFVAAAKRTYGSKATPALLEKKAHAYGKWFPYWSLYLWASTFVAPS